MHTQQDVHAGVAFMSIRRLEKHSFLCSRLAELKAQVFQQQVRRMQYSSFFLESYVPSIRQSVPEQSQHSIIKLVNRCDQVKLLKKLWKLTKMLLSGCPK
jgi:hypothetical protein